MQGLKIGAVATRAGVNIDTLRYYERQGLVTRPHRTRSNYRIYPEDTIGRVRFVKQAQELGFSLSEIKKLLELRATPDGKCEDVRREALRKIEEIEEKIRSLDAIKAALSKLAEECASARGSVSDCPILEYLNLSGTGDEQWKTKPS